MPDNVDSVLSANSFREDVQFIVVSHCHCKPNWFLEMHYLPAFVYFFFSFALYRSHELELLPLPLFHAEWPYDLFYFSAIQREKDITKKLC